MSDDDRELLQTRIATEKLLGRKWWCEKCGHPISLEEFAMIGNGVLMHVLEYPALNGAPKYWEHQIVPTEHAQTHDNDIFGGERILPRSEYAEKQGKK